MLTSVPAAESYHKKEIWPCAPARPPPAPPNSEAGHTADVGRVARPKNACRVVGGRARWAGGKHVRCPPPACSALPLTPTPPHATTHHRLATGWAADLGGSSCQGLEGGVVCERQPWRARGAAADAALCVGAALAGAAHCHLGSGTANSDGVGRAEVARRAAGRVGDRCQGSRVSCCSLLACSGGTSARHRPPACPPAACSSGRDPLSPGGAAIPVLAGVLKSGLAAGGRVVVQQRV